MKPAPRPTATTIDGYLSQLSSEQRAALERLRRTIHAAVPGLEECISYQMPAFRHEGKVLVWFAAAKNHLSLFPGGIVDAFAGDLADYVTSKGTIRFQPTRPLPATLVRKILRAKLERMAATKPAPKKPAPKKPAPKKPAPKKPAPKRRG